MDLRAACLGEFSVPAIFLAFLLLLFGSEKPPAPFFQQLFSQISR